MPSFYLLVVVVAGWIHRDQKYIINYLIEVQQKQLGKQRLQLDNEIRCRLAIKGKKLGRKLLSQLLGIVTPDTLLRWHRQLIAKK